MDSNQITAILQFIIITGGVVALGSQWIKSHFNDRKFNRVSEMKVFIQEAVKEEIRPLSEKVDELNRHRDTDRTEFQRILFDLFKEFK